MIVKKYETNLGDIEYYVNEIDKDKITLIFLPGLTADHRLFEKQFEYFEGKYNILSWDAPGHTNSRPFSLDFDLFDKARWLYEILKKEDIRKPVLVGQSMGAYVGQAFSELYPDELIGFVSIDSAPLAKKYIPGFDLWVMDNSEMLYSMYSWQSLLSAGSKGCATTEYGIKLMYDMMNSYSGKKEYVKLVGHGYRMLANSIRADLKYEIKCPALLICGTKDAAGTTKKYNVKWNKISGIPIKWIDGAGHNSNSDKPDEVNKILDDFVSSI